jgi:hypothetical protein
VLTLTPDELRDLTGYLRPGDQLRSLHEQGFVRARLNALGTVVLERAHYNAVCEGRYARPLEAVQNDRPRVKRHAETAT